MIFRPLISLFTATFFLTNQSAPVGAETFSLPFGERVVVVELPIGCLLTESRQGSYNCQYSTPRNMLGGSHDEISEIIVAAKEVNPSEIIDFGENLSVENAQNPDVVSVDVADASQKYILGTDHPVSRSAEGMFEHLSLVGKLGDNNSLVVSQKQPWGGSDCRIFVTGTALKMRDSSLLGVEQGGMRCILWSYLIDEEDTVHALDVLVEVREFDDFQPNGSEAFTSFWQPIIESIRFE
jgi:hypothetical protein